MHQHPFDLLQVQRLDATGSPCGNPLWLLLGGEQRRALSLADGQQSYHQRFNLEHFLGFAKPHLLLTASQTSYTHREINWVRLACLAYVQLWIARHLVDSLPLLWQRYCSPPSPSTVHSSSGSARILSTYSADWLDCHSSQTSRYLTRKTERHSILSSCPLSYGQISSPSQALPVQTLPGRWLISSLFD